VGSGLPRGFVTRAQRIAREERAGIGLTDEDPLNPWDLAAEHGVEVLPLSLFVQQVGRSAELLLASRADRFSAMQIPDGNGCFIIENDSHHLTRRRTNVSHELGHLLLEHPFHPSLLLDDCRGTTGPLEVEADRLAQELLMPRRAIISSLRNGLSDADIASHFGVSGPYATMRLNMSGARRQYLRERARRRR
jgi:Zn-dependent peptidase ImmA (M78 family)